MYCARTECVKGNGGAVLKFYESLAPQTIFGRFFMKKTVLERV